MIGDTNTPATPTVVATAPTLATKVVNHGSHTVTYVRITPPALPALPQATPPPHRQLTPEEQAVEDARAAKTHEWLGISCMVYIGTPTVTELTWWNEGKRYRAWSNVNFSHLTQLTQLETETHIFAWFPAVSDCPVSDIPEGERPTGLSLFAATDTAPEYYFEGTEQEMTEAAGTLLGLDYLHAYYQLHREKLVADYTKRLEEAAAHEAELARNPPKPADTVIHFWKVPASTP